MWQYAIDFAISLSDTEIKIISAYHANNTQAVIKQMICLSPAFRNQLRGVADVKFFTKEDGVYARKYISRRITEEELRSVLSELIGYFDDDKKRR